MSCGGDGRSGVEQTGDGRCDSFSACPSPVRTGEGGRRPGEGCGEKRIQCEEGQGEGGREHNFISTQRRQGARARRINIPKGLRHSAQRWREGGRAPAPTLGGESQIEIYPERVAPMHAKQ